MSGSRTSSPASGEPAHSRGAVGDGGAIVSWFAVGRRGTGWYHRPVAMVSFGEFLVARGLLDRFQLLRVLQFQARHPATRLGECVVACGFLGLREIEAALIAHDGDRARSRLARGTAPMPALADDEG